MSLLLPLSCLCFVLQPFGDFVLVFNCFGLVVVPGFVNLFLLSGFRVWVPRCVGSACVRSDVFMVCGIPTGCACFISSMVSVHVVRPVVCCSCCIAGWWVYVSFKLCWWWWSFGVVL